MGLNMPARTVIFSSVSKFDGVVSRSLTSGEYIQVGSCNIFCSASTSLTFWSW